MTPSPSSLSGVFEYQSTDSLIGLREAVVPSILDRSRNGTTLRQACGVACVRQIFELVAGTFTEKLYRWFDADTIILNQNIPWEAFLPPSDTFPDINFLGNKDWNGFNCGVFFLRINEWSVNFLTEASALPLLRPEVELGTRAPNYEQDAMVWVLDKEGYREHVVYQPRQWYNPFAEGEHHELEHERGDLLIHFPGMPEKHTAIGRWLDKVDQSSEELTIPVSNLTLKAEIAQFWTRLNNAKGLLDRAWDLQSDDQIVQMFVHNPILGDELKDAADRLHKIYQETPFQTGKIRNAHIKLSNAIRETKKARREVQQANRENAKAKLDRAKDREKNGDSLS